MLPCYLRLKNSTTWELATTLTTEDKSNIAFRLPFFLTRRYLPTLNTFYSSPPFFLWSSRDSFTLEQYLTPPQLNQRRGSSSNYEMGQDGSDYPSPRSEGASGAAAVLVATQDPLAAVPKMNDQMSPSFMEGARPRLSVRRARDPPKNAVGQIFCDHAECQPSPPTFRRPCEWNKHMDKHDRPYKCLEPGCDKIQGFTYSGGLLRHQREVHKKNVNAKKPLMCPYPDCNRSTGNGFTRQENLKEHLRRRHMHTENGPAPDLAIVPSPDLDGTTSLQAVKRKRDSLDDDPTDPTDPTIAFPEDEENAVDMRGELKRLRREVQEKDRRLQELERIVAGLQQVIPHPQATVSQG